MKERLLRELGSLPENFVVLTILPSDRYEEANLHLLDIMINQKQHVGGYIAVNRPYKSLIKLLESKNIDHNKIFFIDCMSRIEQKAKNCVFLKSAESLTNIALALDPLFKQKACSFIILDSLDSLSIYNKVDSVIKFSHELIGKMREHELNGVMIGVHEDTDKKIINQLAIVCDKTIDLTKE